MQVTINGEARGFESVLALGALVDLLGLDRRKVAIERNGAIVPRSLHADTILVDGDAIEIVHFVGGG